MRAATSTQAVRYICHPMTRSIRAPRLSGLLRVVALAVLLALLAMLQGCIFAVSHGARYAYREYQKQGKEVSAALTYYESSVRANDPDALADLFDTQAQWSQDGRSFAGRKAIRVGVAGAAGTRVTVFELRVSDTRPSPDGVAQVGTYHQTVTTSSGTEGAGEPQTTRTTQGVFGLRWVHRSGEPWLIANWHATAVADGNPAVDPVSEFDAVGAPAASSSASDPANR